MFRYVQARRVPFMLMPCLIISQCIVPLPFIVAQKVVATRKKQQLSIGPCKSLPNSPSHSSVCAAPVSAVHITQVSEPPPPHTRISRTCNGVKPV